MKKITSIVTTSLLSDIHYSKWDDLVEYVRESLLPKIPVEDEDVIKLKKSAKQPAQ